MAFCQRFHRAVLVCLLAALGGPPGLASNPEVGTGFQVPAPGKGAALKNKSKRAKEKARKARARLAKGLPVAEPKAEAGKPTPAKERPAGGQQLRGYWIRPGESLAGAQFTGAVLAGYDFTGVSLKGARLFGASTFGAIGLDLKGAEVHPFFTQRGQEKVGRMKFLRLPKDPYAGDADPHSLVCSGEGLLFWLNAQDQRIQCITPAGDSYRTREGVGKNRRMYALVKDSNERLWGFGDRSFFNINLKEYTRQLQAGTQLFPQAADERPEDVRVGPNGNVWASWPSKVVNIKSKPTLHPDLVKYEASYMNRPEEPTRIAVAQDPQETSHFFTMADLDIISIHELKSGAYTYKELPTGSRPWCPAMGPGNSVWFLLSGTDRLLLFRTPAQEPEMITLPAMTGGARRGLSSLALGPDGNMWFTQETAGRIGRFSLKPDCEPFLEWQLPRGYHPVEIIPGHDGRMLFSVRGERIIGSIRAVDAPGEAVPDTTASFKVPDFHPAPGRESKHPSRAERHAQMDAWLQEAERRAQERLRYEEPEPQPKPDWFWTQAQVEAALAGRAPEQKEGREEKKAQVPEVEPQSPAETLAAVGAALPPTALRHILERHGKGRMAHKSQFAEEYGKAEAIEALIARHLPGEWAKGEDYEYDDWGRTVTYCRQEGVGCHNFHGQLIPTRRFAVVTEHVFTEQGLKHAVVTAYPVADGSP